MEDLKMLIRMKRIPMWKVAETVGVSEMTIYRWMRKYDAVHYAKITKALEELERTVDNEQNSENE